MVARLVRDQKAAGSNPATSTQKPGMPLGAFRVFAIEGSGYSKPKGLAKAVGERAERQHSVLTGVAGREANESIETSNATAPREQCED